jgi:hypothetical protein
MDFLTIRGHWRTFLGRCPACNSTPWYQETCPVCLGQVSYDVDPTLGRDWIDRFALCRARLRLTRKYLEATTDQELIILKAMQYLVFKNLAPETSILQQALCSRLQEADPEAFPASEYSQLGRRIEWLVIRGLLSRDNNYLKITIAGLLALHISMSGEEVVEFYGGQVVID